jgi:hypothetical protein
LPADRADWNPTTSEAISALGSRLHCGPATDLGTRRFLKEKWQLLRSLPEQHHLCAELCGRGSAAAFLDLAAVAP